MKDRIFYSRLNESDLVYYSSKGFDNIDPIKFMKIDFSSIKPIIDNIFSMDNTSVDKKKLIHTFSLDSNGTRSFRCLIKEEDLSKKKENAGTKEISDFYENKKIIIDEVNDVLNFMNPAVRNSLLLNIYNLKTKIDIFITNQNRYTNGLKIDSSMEQHTKIYNQSYFVGMLLTNIINTTLLKEILRYIDSIYVPDDSTIKSDLENLKNSKVFSPGISFGLESTKMILVIAYLMKILAPIIIHYSDIMTDTPKHNTIVNKISDIMFLRENDKTSKLNILTLMSEISILIIKDYKFKTLLGEEIDIYEKINAILNILVGESEQRNTILWNKLSTLHVTSERVKYDIRDKLFSTSLVKCSNGGSPISYFRTTIELSLKYTLDKDYGIKSHTISETNNSDDNNMDDTLFLTLKSIGEVDINETIDLDYVGEDTINKLCLKLNINRKDPTLEYFKNNLNMYEHKHMLNELIYYFRVFLDFFGGDKNNIGSLNLEHINELLGISYMILKNNGINLISELIVSKYYGNNINVENKELNKFLEELHKDYDFQKLIFDKYTFAHETLMDRTNLEEKVFQDRISLLLKYILTNEFLYNSPNSTENTMIKIDKNILLNEFKKFLQIIV